MWRQEAGFLEMFLAYYSQFEENVSEKKAYRDFLLEVLCSHEISLQSNSTEAEAAGKLTAEASFSWFDAIPLESSSLSMDSDAALRREIKKEVVTEAEEEERRESQMTWGISGSEPVGAAVPEDRGHGAEVDFSMKAETSLPPCLPSVSVPDGTMLERVAAGVVDLSSDLSSELGEPSVSAMRLDEGGKPFRCKTCAETFASRTLLLQHARSHDSSSSRNFAQIVAFHSHRRSRGPTPLSCRFCQKSFTDRSHLRTHERIHTGERPFLCKICHKSFNQSSNLRTHERSHHGPEQFPYVCSYCDKGFFFVSLYRRHARSHTGEKPFVCKTCGMTFRAQSQLCNHEVTHVG